jgi:hypothetical protein
LNQDGGGGQGMGIWFRQAGLTAGIGSTRVSSGDWATDLRFYTHPSSTTNQNTLFERMRINSEGNVGIGTDSPAYRLDVNAANSGDGLRVRNGGTSKIVANGDGVLTWGAAADYGALTWDTGFARINAFASYDLRMTTSAGGLLVLKSGGNVSIGTTTTYAKLHVHGNTLNSSAETSYGIWVSDATTVEKGLILGYDNTGDVGIINAAHRGQSWKSVALGTNSGSNVLIGTTTDAGYKLNVVGNSRFTNTIASTTGANGISTIDTSVSFVTLGNGSFVDFPAMSGMIIVNNLGNGAVQVFICGGGNTSSLGFVISSTGTMTHSPGVGGYRFTNNTGSTWAFSFQAFKTRGTA